MDRRVRSFVSACALACVLSAPAFAAAPEANGPGATPGPIARLGSTDLRHATAVQAVAFSPDGRRLASSALGVLCVWDPTTGRKVLQRKIDNQTVAMSFVGDGNSVGWVTRDGEVKVLDLSSGGGPRAFPMGSGAQSAQFSRDGGVVLAGVGTGVAIWRVADGNALGGGVSLNHICNPALAPDGNAFAMVLINNANRNAPYETQLWLAGESNAAWTSRGSMSPASLAFSPDGRLLAAATNDGKVTIQDARTGAKVSTFSSGKTIPVQCMTFVPGGTRIAGVTQEALQVWEANQGPSLLRIDAQARSILGLAASPDGTLLATAGLAASPDGTLLATAGPGPAVSLWDLRTGKPRFAVRGHVGAVVGLAFAGGGEGLLSAGADGTMRRWRLADGNDETLLAPKDKATQWSAWAAISPDAALAVSRGRGSRTGLSVWDLQKAALVRDVEMEGSATAAALSFDGRLLAAAQGEAIGIWQVSTGRQARRFESSLRLRGSATMAFSPDGRMLAAGSGNVRLIELATGKSAATIAPTSGQIRALAISPDGRRLAGTDANGAFVFDLAADARSAWLEAPADAFATAFSADGMRIATAGAEGEILVWHAPRAFPAAATRPANANDLAAAWESLAGSDAAQAYEAANRLLCEGPAAVAFLSARLRPLPRPSPPPDPNKILAELDNDSYRGREEASRKLAALADERFLQEALARAKSDEVRGRLAELLTKLADPFIADAEELRASRAVRVLELLADAPARELLARLAEGGPGRLTREARAALARLKAQDGKTRVRP